MNCPYCSRKMVKGFIEQTRIMVPLEWYPAEREGGSAGSNNRNIKLSSHLKGGIVTVYRCEVCRKMIINEGED